MSEPSCYDRLRDFRTELGLSQRKAGAALGVSGVMFRSWELGIAVPSKRFRKAIEVWTVGTIREDAWPLSARERRLDECASAVRPAIAPTESGPLPLDATPTDGTGTDDG